MQRARRGGWKSVALVVAWLAVVTYGLTAVQFLLLALLGLVGQLLLWDSAALVIWLAARDLRPQGLWVPIVVGTIWAFLISPLVGPEYLLGLVEGSLTWAAESLFACAIAAPVLVLVDLHWRRKQARMNEREGAL